MDDSRLSCLLLLLGEEEFSAGDMTQAFGLVQSKFSWYYSAPPPNQSLSITTSP